MLANLAGTSREPLGPDSQIYVSQTLEIRSRATWENRLMTDIPREGTIVPISQPLKFIINGDVFGALALAPVGGQMNYLAARENARTDGPPLWISQSQIEKSWVDWRSPPTR